MKFFTRFILLIIAAGISLQIFFVFRIATMAVVDPQSTAFQRSEAWTLLVGNKPMKWSQEWVPYSDISDNLKRAVIASEDDDFINHDGIEWDAIEKAWQKNAKAEEIAARRAEQARGSQNARVRTPKIVGGSTITQQLAKNLFLSGERTFFRKGQEFVLAMLLEAFLSKQRILELYLNSVEWGEGVFGAEAASQRYFHKPASKLSAYEAARLAVMLPRPKFFESLPNSAYVANRASTIVARMGGAQLP